MCKVFRLIICGIFSYPTKTLITVLSMNFALRFVYFFLFLAPFSLVVNAQDTRSIIDELNSASPGKGTVAIYQDEAIKGIVGKSIAASRPVYTSDDDSSNYIKMRGFKIQAFSGNNQRTSKNEAYSKQSQIKNTFPELETVINFDSPFWRLRVGNFRSRTEATKVLDDLRGAFPSFGKEMYIVPDEVKIPVNN